MKKWKKQELKYMLKAGRIRVIIDTNLFISFLIGKRLKGLKALLINNQVELIFAEQNLQELKMVTQRPKFQKGHRERMMENINTSQEQSQL